MLKEMFEFWLRSHVLIIQLLVLGPRVAWSFRQLRDDTKKSLI